MRSRMYELTRIHTGQQLTPLAKRVSYHYHYWPNIDSEAEELVLDFVVASGDFCGEVKECIKEGFVIRDGPADGDVVLMDLPELEQAITGHIKKLEAIGLFAYATIATRPIRTLDGYDFADTLIVHVRHAKVEQLRVPARLNASRHE